MKKQALLVASVCLAIGFAAAPAHAQAGALRANVKFDFTFAGKNFPAGEYTMFADPARRLVTVQDSQKNMTAASLYVPSSDRTVAANGRAIFQCYAEHCFLGEVWTPGRQVGAKFYASSAEKELARKETKTYMAVAGETKTATGQ